MKYQITIKGEPDYEDTIDVPSLFMAVAIFTDRLNHNNPDTWLLADVAEFVEEV